MPQNLKKPFTNFSFTPYILMSLEERQSYESQLFILGANELFLYSVRKENYPIIYALLEGGNVKISKETIENEIPFILGRRQINLFYFLSQLPFFIKTLDSFDILATSLIEVCGRNHYGCVKNIIEIEKQKENPQLDKLLSFRNYEALRWALTGGHMSEYHHKYSPSERPLHPLDALFEPGCLSFSSPDIQAIIERGRRVLFLEEIKIAQDKEMLTQMIETQTTLHYKVKKNKI